MSAPAFLFKLESSAWISQVASRIDTWFATRLGILFVIFGYDLKREFLRTTD
jgi:hypothetical protein